MNKYLFNSIPHPSKSIFDLIRGKPEYINLTVGQADIKPPALLTKSLSKIFTDNKTSTLIECHLYADSQGLFKLRYEIAKRYKNHYSLNIDPKNILVTNGGAEAIWLTIYTLTNYGDSVLISDPSYMLYAPIITSLGRCIIRIPTEKNNNFKIEPEQIIKYAQPNTRLLIINSPANPTGTVYNYEQLFKLSQAALSIGLMVMHDEVFDDICFDNTHTPVCQIFPDSKNVIMINSFSKRFNITGWRLGWMIAGDEVIKQAVKAHTYTNLATNTFIQYAVAKVMNDISVEKEVYANNKILQKRISKFSMELNNLPGFDVSLPMGGFYVFPNIQELYNELVVNKTQVFSNKNTPGEIVAKFLLDTCKVAVVPGSGFGSQGNNFIRLCAARSDNLLNEAIERLNKL